MTMKLFGLLILAVFASEKNENDAENGPNYAQNNGSNEEISIVVKIEEDEYAKVNKKSKYIGVSYHKNTSKWYAQRWFKDENKNVSNGLYDDEETAAHASDTLARQLMNNDKPNLKLNFPEDYTKVYSKEKSSKYIGVSYCEKKSKWYVQRWSKNENKNVSNGLHEDEETAAHASDTLARKLMDHGEQNLKLNFPDDDTEVYPKNGFSSNYVGVSSYKNVWYAQRWSKNENKNVSNGYYDDEKTAAHASDTLARNLMDNGEQNLKLNFPDDYTRVYPQNEKKRKRTKNLSLEHPQNN